VTAIVVRAARPDDVDGVLELWARAREHARELGGRRIDAMVDGNNDLGVNFWSAVGFTVLAHADRRFSSLV
jgi:hypothetical protein